MPKRPVLSEACDGVASKLLPDLVGQGYWVIIRWGTHPNRRYWLAYAKDYREGRLKRAVAPAKNKGLTKVADWLTKVADGCRPLAHPCPELDAQMVVKNAGKPPSD